MREIFNSNCIVTLATVENILGCNDIAVHRHGVHASSLFGNTFALMPVSLMVSEDDYWDAARILRETARAENIEAFRPSCDREKPSFFKP